MEEAGLQELEKKAGTAINRSMTTMLWLLMSLPASHGRFHRGYHH